MESFSKLLGDPLMDQYKGKTMSMKENSWNYEHEIKHWNSGIMNDIENQAI